MMGVGRGYFYRFLHHVPRHGCLRMGFLGPNSMSIDRLLIVTDIPHSALQDPREDVQRKLSKKARHCKYDGIIGSRR